MAIIFDPAEKRIILDSTYVEIGAVYSRWKEWVVESDNAKFLPAFSVVGGDPLGGGLFVASYFFLENGWRIRPMEANHLLIIDGNVSVKGGGSPVVQTLGTFNVSVQYTVPVQAQGISTSGGSTDANAVAAAVASLLSAQLEKLNQLNVSETGLVDANVVAVADYPIKKWTGSEWVNS